MNTTRAESPDKPDHASTTLWHRLDELGVLWTVTRRGIRQAGVPQRLLEDAEQEAYIEMFQKPAGPSWSNGQCVNCGLVIAKRVGMRVRRSQAMATYIPKYIYDREHPEMSTVTPDMDWVEAEIDRVRTTMAETDPSHLERLEKGLDEQQAATLHKRLSGLSPMHRCVFFSVLSGDSVGATARRLGIKEKSVRRYVKRVLDGLGRHGLVRTVAACLVAVFVVTASTGALAHDLGQQSKTYDITEPDIRAVILGQVAALDMKKIGKGMADRAEDFPANMRAIHLSPVNQTRTHFVDMSVTVKKDFYVPVFDDHDKLRWELIAPAGTRVNTLDHIRPVTAFLIVDATSKKQRKFALAALKAAPNYIKILVSAGDPAMLAKKINTPIYRASPWILQQFRVTHEPALVRPGYGAHTSEIAVTALAQPWTVQALKAVDPMRGMSIPQARQYTVSEATQ